ncbi:hypothetical protein K435DRAFT_874476, partial [Dendrothele bispora CBS 962.96]
MLCKGQSGRAFAVWDGWDGQSIKACVTFDLAEIALSRQTLDFPGSDTDDNADVQDNPQLRGDDVSPPCTTPPSPPLPDLESSPPSSPTSSRSPSPQFSGKRKRGTRRGNKKKRVQLDPSSVIPTQPSPSTQKDTTARSHISRSKQRSRAKNPTAYQPRQKVGQSLLQNLSPLPANINSHNMSEATSGYIGKGNGAVKEGKARAFWTLEELCGPDGLGFTCVPAS